MIMDSGEGVDASKDKSPRVSALLSKISNLQKEVVRERDEKELCQLENMKLKNQISRLENILSGIESLLKGRNDHGESASHIPLPPNLESKTTISRQWSLDSSASEPKPKRDPLAQRRRQESIHRLMRQSSGGSTVSISSEFVPPEPPGPLAMCRREESIQRLLNRHISNESSLSTASDFVPDPLSYCRREESMQRMLKSNKHVDQSPRDLRKKILKGKYRLHNNGFNATVRKSSDPSKKLNDLQIGRSRAESYDSGTISYGDWESESSEYISNSSSR